MFTLVRSMFIPVTLPAQVCAGKVADIRPYAEIEHNNYEIKKGMIYTTIL